MNKILNKKIFTLQNFCHNTARTRAVREEFQWQKLRRASRGNVLTLTVLVFTMASLALSLGIISPIVKHIKTVRGSMYSKQAFFTAESLQEDILYRLKKNILVGNSVNMTLNESTSNAVISGVSDKTIVVDSDDSGFKRKMISTVVQGEGASFSYGIQTGLGGFEMANNAKVIGNVYSNGDISGGSITGTAISAMVPNPIADQLNTGDVSPSNSIEFGGNATPRDIAQGFKMSTTTPLASVRLYVKKSSLNPINDASVQIVNDESGKPGKTVLGTATMNASTVGTSYDYIELPFSSLVHLAKNTQYWLVVYSLSGSTYSERYTIGATADTYSNGKAMVGTWSNADGGIWANTTPDNLDIYFRLYVSGNIGTIENVNVGTSGVGDAWANTISGGTVAGTKYCKVGDDCNTSRLDPVAQAYPLSEGNITDWRADAFSGGVIGSQTISSTKTLGPIKIDGDLIVNDVLNVSGTIWVTGNFFVGNKKTVQLAPDYGGNSGIIIVDGKTTLENNSIFSGSGLATSSYVMLVSTSNCDYANCDNKYAIDVSNNAGAVILNAQKGTINFNNNSGAKSAVANKIILENGATITYEKGLIDVNFSSGPSGAWSIDSWRESTD
jgi:hypothetical protein